MPDGGWVGGYLRPYQFLDHLTVTKIWLERIYWSIDKKKDNMKIYRTIDKKRDDMNLKLDLRKYIGLWAGGG